MGRSFLTTYRPLCRTARGREAVERFDLKPYIDGSCRREPDFEAPFPTITALCRGRMFAPRLRIDDRIAYMTKKGAYPGAGGSHWRLVALLRVAQRFESHKAAAEWFSQRGLAVPRNCMVRDTTPVPLDHTDGQLPPDLRARAQSLSAQRLIELWNSRYAKRARVNPQVLVCEPIFVNLMSPPAIVEEDWMRWLGRVPATRTPPVIPDSVWQNLVDLAGSFTKPTAAAETVPHTD